MDVLFTPQAQPRSQCLSVPETLPRLGDLSKVPERAFLWGSLPPGPWVAIVGTRRPTDQGRLAARRLANDLASRGVTIVSGGAIGIDAEAHRGALEVGGRTLVVAPTWWDHIYPSAHRHLFEEVLEKGGGYLTVAEQHTPALQPAFFARNEALAGLCHAIVLGDCPFRSGARNAMKHARVLGRPRFCLPWTYGDPTGFGGHQEVSLGAKVLLGPEMVLDFLRQTGAHDNPWWWQYLESFPRSEPFLAAQQPQSGPGTQSLGPRPKRAKVIRKSLAGNQTKSLIFKAIVDGAGTAEAVVTQTGLAPEEAQHQILILTLEGEVYEDESGILRYHRRPHELP